MQRRTRRAPFRAPSGAHSRARSQLAARTSSRPLCTTSKSMCARVNNSRRRGDPDARISFDAMFMTASFRLSRLSDREPPQLRCAPPSDNPVRGEYAAISSGRDDSCACGGAGWMRREFRRSGDAPPARRMNRPHEARRFPPSPQNSASPSQAFLEGYRAYQNHDLATATERLGYASDHFPQLADYALYYRGLAQRDSGDLAASAATFEKLIRTYPESVTIADAEVALSDVYLATHARELMPPRRLPEPSRGPPIRKSNSLRGSHWRARLRPKATRAAPTMR